MQVGRGAARLCNISRILLGLTGSTTLSCENSRHSTDAPSPRSRAKQRGNAVEGYTTSCHDNPPSHEVIHKVKLGDNFDTLGSQMSLAKYSVYPSHGVYRAGIYLVRLTSIYKEAHQLLDTYEDLRLSTCSSSRREIYILLACGHIVPLHLRHEYAQDRTLHSSETLHGISIYNATS
ncbi:hypothetical protein F4810DRAFT_316450 [Camillea tinctor]|nr:hypothetical protein F4810DRAFT_316450 [Camillea tinctor]